MAATPQSIKVPIDSAEVQAAIKEAAEQGEKVGYSSGLKQGRNDILGWLQHAYIDDEGRPDRGSPKAEAVLELSQNAARYIRSLPKEQA